MLIRPSVEPMSVTVPVTCVVRVIADAVPEDRCTETRAVAKRHQHPNPRCPPHGELAERKRELCCAPLPDAPTPQSHGGRQVANLTCAAAGQGQVPEVDGFQMLSTPSKDVPNWEPLFPRTKHNQE